MQEKWCKFHASESRLMPGLFQDRMLLNRKYLMQLEGADLLQSFYLEAGFYTFNEPKHKGWEVPTSPFRGHFLGHWLSGAARMVQSTGDAELKAKADWIVGELDKCQKANGGEWLGSLPEKQMDWIAAGRFEHGYVPQYMHHKTLMGLYEMYALAGNSLALKLMKNYAKWFHRWTSSFSKAQLSDILDYETGGMMEVWADLYSVTGKKEHLELMERYARHRLFDALLLGEDPLTNMHANTTVPEIHGAARAYEVTGDIRWRNIVDAFWRCAVTDRGTFCTGGQTTGEVWTAPFAFSARLGDKNQEHCFVYNMIRLADYLLRWTGDTVYADYIERNIYNGILAQQNLQNGMVSYFLPLEAGATKKWGTPYDHFWCCHGSLVQVQSSLARQIYYRDETGNILVSQYIPSELHSELNGQRFHLKQTTDRQTNSGIRDTAKDSTRRSDNNLIHFEVDSDTEIKFAIRLRVPWWVKETPSIHLNGVRIESVVSETRTIDISRDWKKGDHLSVEWKYKLTTDPLPDNPNVVAFMAGPVVLAGLVEEERILIGDKDRPETILIPDNEREWSNWKYGYRTVNQRRGFKLIPLHEVVDEKYTVYFPIILSCQN